MKGKIGIVILAAGSSQRLGEPKQLLPWKQSTLIENVVDIALALPCEPVIVVLGAENERLKPVIPVDVKVVINNRWPEGVASSIREGVGGLKKLYPESQGVLFMSCDQPLIREDHLRKMLMLFEQSDKTIVAAEYAGTVGIPVIFTRAWFSELTLLKGDQGAKILFEKNSDELTTLSIPEAQWDIDDWETYHQLRSMDMGKDITQSKYREDC